MNSTTKLVIDELAESIDIPDSAYEKAEARYADLGKWYSRDEAHCAPFDPHIYPQGSFRLGTVIRAEEYDLDFGCRLRHGVSKATHTQEEIKNLVGADMEAYRGARGIEQKLEEKTRCWRLHYKDEMPFHMDGVPSIPEEAQQRVLLEQSMIKFGADQFLAQTVAKYAGSITDNRHPHYRLISPAWRISNSEGYAKWFESRMKLAAPLMEKRALAANRATVDDLPARKWKSPLQLSVQLLKTHRDIMFADNCAAKPISIILTSLAAQAYQGESDVSDAMEGILTRMGSLVRTTKPRVPNPVNPAEDFADKWYDPAYRHLHLEENFNEWLKRAKSDFDVVGQSHDPEFITEQAMTKFGATLNTATLRSKMGIGTTSYIRTQPKAHNIEAPAKPWGGK